MQNIVFTLSVVAPVFLIVGLGYFLKTIGLIDRYFVSISTKVVFIISLPVLIFMELSSIDFNEVLNIRAIGYIYSGTLFIFLITWFYARKYIPNGQDQGAFLQGSFRGNLAIIGLALINNLFGGDGLAKASLFLAFIIPLYNILAVVALSVPIQRERQVAIAHTLIEIMKNPLIIAVIVSIAFSFTGWHLNPVLSHTGNYLASIALPLALLGIGGALDFKKMLHTSTLAIIASGIKLIIIPAALTYGAYLLGFKGTDLGILYIFFACPSAIASFVMAEAMESNGDLAANIVLLTTVFSLITITAGLVFLQHFGILQPTGINGNIF